MEGMRKKEGGEEGREGRAKNDLTHSLSQIPGYATPLDIWSDLLNLFVY